MKPKLGRPKEENPNTINLTVRINDKLSERLNKHCAQSGESKGEVVRKGIEYVLDKENK